MGLAVVSFHPVLAKQSKGKRDIPPRALGRGAVRGLGGRRAGGCGAGLPAGMGPGSGRSARCAGEGERSGNHNCVKAGVGEVLVERLAKRPEDFPGRTVQPLEGF